MDDDGALIMVQILYTATYEVIHVSWYQVLEAIQNWRIETFILELCESEASCLVT